MFAQPFEELPRKIYRDIKRNNITLKSNLKVIKQYATALPDGNQIVINMPFNGTMIFKSLGPLAFLTITNPSLTPNSNNVVVSINDNDTNSYIDYINTEYGYAEVSINNDLTTNFSFTIKII